MFFTDIARGLSSDYEIRVESVQTSFPSSYKFWQIRLLSNRLMDKPVNIISTEEVMSMALKIRAETQRFFFCRVVGAIADWINDFFFSCKTKFVIRITLDPRLSSSKT